MATYAWANRGAGLPFQSPGYAPFIGKVDIPDIIANGGLVNTSGVATALASTGFAAADILQMFEVPAWFLLKQVGVDVTTAETGTGNIDIGNASDTQTHLLAAAATGYMGTCDITSATTQVTLVTDTHLGADSYQGVVFITAGTIDITFVNAATATAIFDVWADGCMVK